MNLIKKHDEGCLEHNIDKELPECICIKDTWNLANKVYGDGSFFSLDIKTFIQKVKEDFRNKYEKIAIGNLITPEENDKILDKRAGDL